MEENHKNVLIIDDDTFLRDMYAKKFTDMEHKVEVVPSAKEAKERLQTKSYDIILLDLVMPETDGFEFFGQAKEDNILGGAAVIVLTNQSREKDIERARELGADGYIVKASSIPTEVVLEAVEIVESNSDEMVVKQ